MTFSSISNEERGNAKKKKEKRNEPARQKHDRMNTKIKQMNKPNHTFK